MFEGGEGFGFDELTDPGPSPFDEPLRQPQVGRQMMVPPRQAMVGPTRPGPTPPRGIFSSGVPALAAVEITTSHLLGLSVLLPAVGTVIGMRYGGMWGGMGGAVAMGSVVNAYRAIKNVMQGTTDGDREALISGTYAVIGLAGSGYLIWRGLSRGGAFPNKADDDDDDEYSLRGTK